MPAITTTHAAPIFDFKHELTALIPFLRAFSRSLCPHGSKAEDLAQEALLKAWRARATFQPGTNLKAWLFTILRNEFYSRARREWRQMPWDETAAARIPAAANQQQWHLELCDVAEGLRRLPSEQREALILIGAGGFSYEEVSEICGCAIGTIKSRVSRARDRLALILAEGSQPADGRRPSDAMASILGQLEALSSRRAA